MRSKRAAALALLLSVCCACRERPRFSVAAGRIVRARPDAARSLLALIPDRARAGEVLQAQPDGRAGLSLLGTGFSRGDVVSWGGRHLSTTYGHSRLLTATVPAELLARPGEVEVTIENAADPSKTKLRATFRLLRAAP